MRQRMAEAWRWFLSKIDRPGSPGLVVQHHGEAGVPAVYATVLAGRAPPFVGHMSLPRGG